MELLSKHLHPDALADPRNRCAIVAVMCENLPQHGAQTRRDALREGSHLIREDVQPSEIAVVVAKGKSAAH